MPEHSSGSGKLSSFNVIREISCGMFDEHDTVVKMHEWQLTGDDMGTVRNDRGASFFRVKFPPTKANTGDRVTTTFMDMHHYNIHGIIDEVMDEQQAISFVMHKPPHFYKCKGEPIDGLEKTRVSHPSSGPDDRDTVKIAGIPWYIQFSRVWRMLYHRKAPDQLIPFLESFGPLRGKQIPVSNPTGLLQTLKEHLKLINTNKHLKKYPEIRLAVFGVFLNCNLCPVLHETTGEIRNLELALDHARPGKFDRDPVQRRRFRRNVYNAIRRGTQNAGTHHMRALKRLRQEHERNTYWLDPLIALNIFNTKIGEHPPLEVFTLYVYPSHIELHGPAAASSNSVLENNRNEIDRFIRVKFIDNHDKPLRREPGVILSSIINERVVPILDNDCQPLALIDQQFEFLGYTMSSLKKRKMVYMFRKGRNSDVNASQIRANIGNWNVIEEYNSALARKPSKWGARLSLAFTTSHAISLLPRNTWEVRADKGPLRKFPNTDGCGVISEELCDDINKRLSSLGYRESRAFQIRFGGVKGVVYCAADSLLTYSSAEQGKRQYKMLLRESQQKFRAPNEENMTLRVVSTTSDGWSTLFSGPFIKVLEDSHVNVEKIMPEFRRSYDELATMSTRGLEILQEICRCTVDDIETSPRHMFLRLALRLRKDGLFPEQYANSFLRLYLVRLAERSRAKDMFAIPVPNSYQALGLTDDYKILKEEEVYIRAKQETKEGKVLIYRDPIIHIGDIQFAKALGDQEVRDRLGEGLSDCFSALQKMDNVIFFSQIDNPPFPNRLSGGDLDGDRFEIVTNVDQKESWLWGFKASPHQDYTAESKPPQRTHTDFDVGELTKFIGKYIENDCFSELEEHLMCQADNKDEGMANENVKKLASLLSEAVDYPKSGVGVDLYREIKHHQSDKKPDLIRGFSAQAFGDSNGKYYESQRVLGRLFKEISQKTYHVPSPVGHVTFDGLIAKAPTLGMASSDAETKDPGEGEGEEVTILSINLKAGFYQYLDYLRSRHITRETEVDIFLGKRIDNFPENQLDPLDQIIKNELHMSDVLITYPHIQLGDGRSWDEVTRKYKHLLFQFWRFMLDLSYESNGIGFGQSYAFLCLYAFYFRDFPRSWNVVKTAETSQSQFSERSALKREEQLGQMHGSNGNEKCSNMKSL